MTDGLVAAIAGELGLVEPQVTPLPGGGASRTLRLRDGRQDLVLRIVGAPAVPLGASGAGECTMQALAAAAGLAPAVVLARPAQGLLVTRHVGGRTPGPRDLEDPVFLARLGGWMARLHALAPPAGLPPVDFGERAAAYLQALQARRPSAAVERLSARLAGRRAALAPVTHPASCHHDLHRRNLVDTGEALVAVDWEYAGPGDPAADIAACIGYHDIGPAGLDALLSGYGRDTPGLRARVAALGWIFDCLWFGWNAVAESAGIGADAALQARLLARLAG